MARTSGKLKADKLKLSEKGSPAGRPVEVKYATDYDMVKQGGTLTQGDVSMGKALAKLTGTYQSQGEATLLNMKLNADGMPVDDLEAMLPALGMVMPSGSKLQGGTLSVNVGIVGPVDKLVITGPVRVAQANFRASTWPPRCPPSPRYQVRDRLGHFDPESEHRCACRTRGCANTEH